MDDYIRGNLDRFDTEEPLSGHFERFTGRLNQSAKQRILRPWITLLKVAAVLLIGLVITYAALREFNILKDASGAYLGSTDPELNEAVQYYTTQLNNSYDIIKKLRFNNDQDEKKQVLDELSEMDKQVQSMERDLQQNPSDERVVHAIINFYQVKIEMMDMIIARAQQTSTSIL